MIGRWSEKNEQTFDQIKSKFGQVNVAINTTGFGIKKPIADVTEDDYDKSFAAHSKAALFFIQQAGCTFQARGSIVTIASSLLAAHTPYYAIYPGSKAPVEHCTRAAHKAFGGRGISANTVDLGPTDAPLYYGRGVGGKHRLQQGRSGPEQVLEDRPDRH